MGLITLELVFNASTQLFSDKTLCSLGTFFAGAQGFGNPMGGCSFGHTISINFLKCYRGKIHIF